MVMIDQTHDPALRSWVESANKPDCDFPIQNLPLGVYQPRGGSPRIGVAIGDSILDVSSWLPGQTLNQYCAMNVEDRQALRSEWSRLLSSDSKKTNLHLQSECEMLLPMAIGDFTDFYASIHHATNVGSMFRPDNPLLPNYKHVPIAYHGRSSTIVVSGTDIRRPTGQLGEGKFGPSQELDYETELGVYLGPGNKQGEPIPAGQARKHLVGVCLVNDWSARDIQRWEYQPLGPFLAKNFATSVSPWMITLEALEPFRTEASAHDVPVLPYLKEPSQGAFDITVETLLKSKSMNQPHLVSRASFASMYWTLGQMLTHHASNGCAIRPGDLIASGTISGPDKSNRGCLLELTWRGKEPLVLPDGEQRTFLENGDEVVMTAFCQREGYVRIGMGTCRGTVV
ncbi:MAG: fumarylacetoacetase [Planctomycetia bacterium]|nr:fumarylacetoacetase [Planctomycetia bacterium]